MALAIQNESKSESRRAIKTTKKRRSSQMYMDDEPITTEPVLNEKTLNLWGGCVAEPSMAEHSLNIFEDTSPRKLQVQVTKLANEVKDFSSK